MTIRRLIPSDIPILMKMALESEFPYPDVSRETPEAFMVVTDDENRPMMAAAAVRTVQIYLYCGEFKRPLAKKAAMQLLHEGMALELKAKGWSEADAFLPPSLALKFGRRLEKTFGWVKNWPSWARRF